MSKQGGKAPSVIEGNAVPEVSLCCKDVFAQPPVSNRTFASTQLQAAGPSRPRSGALGVDEIALAPQEVLKGEAELDAEEEAKRLEEAKRAAEEVCA